MEEITKLVARDKEEGLYSEPYYALVELVVRVFERDLDEAYGRYDKFPYGIMTKERMQMQNLLDMEGLYSEIIVSMSDFEWHKCKKCNFIGYENLHREFNVPVCKNCGEIEHLFSATVQP